MTITISLFGLRGKKSNALVAPTFYNFGQMKATKSLFPSFPVPVELTCKCICHQFSHEAPDDIFSIQAPDAPQVTQLQEN